MSDEEDETDYLLDDALLITDAEIEIPSTSAQQGTSGNDGSATTSAIDVIFNKYTVDKTLTLQYLSGELGYYLIYCMLGNFSCIFFRFQRIISGVPLVSNG